jgi:nicotinate-nucleotide adenylyltransferase
VGASRPRLGVIGGSFDPPHIAHLVIASEACSQLGLERVLFVPAAAPPHKTSSPVSSAEVRLDMTTLAVEDDLRFTESGLEVERDLVYTRDTLDAVAQRFPGRDLVFIMGSDSLAQIDSWLDPDGIFERATVAVAPRHVDAEDVIKAAQKRWPGGRIVHLEAPRIALSSTIVRERVAAGRPIRYLVPPAVEAYIVGHQLYRRR